MNILSSRPFLAAYSGVLTLVFAVTVLCGFAMTRNPMFGIITARRINIMEPDGTVRLTISNRADFPGGWTHKKESPRPDRRDAAGMLLMSEEGTEQGGLIWGAGMSLNLIASGRAGFAISYGLGQGATMIAAFWGVFIWKEFRTAPAGTPALLAAMFGSFLAGLALIVLARMT